MKQHSAVVVALSMALSACGGGGGGGASVAVTPSPIPVTPGMSTSTVYANSLTPASTQTIAITYQPVFGAMQASVTAGAASPLLPIGTTLIQSEHVEASLPGIRVVCVSGRGETTNVVTGINLGVLTQSAAVLMDSLWTALDSPVAWSATVHSGGLWSGWENCGTKLEGPPTRSSRLAPTAAGGYTEDVYDGNPGTNFHTILQNVSATDASAMLSAQGLPFLDDPGRPMRLFLRAYGDASGHVVFVQTGVLQAAGATAGSVGFVALYVPGA